MSICKWIYPKRQTKTRLFSHPSAVFSNSENVANNITTSSGNGMVVITRIWKKLHQNDSRNRILHLENGEKPKNSIEKQARINRSDMDLRLRQNQHVTYLYEDAHIGLVWSYMHGNPEVWSLNLHVDQANFANLNFSQPHICLYMFLSFTVSFFFCCFLLS